MFKILTHSCYAGRGLHTLALDTGAANTGAPAFYGRMGYAEESVKLVTAVRK